MGRSLRNLDTSRPWPPPALRVGLGAAGLRGPRPPDAASMDPAGNIWAVPGLWLQVGFSRYEYICTRFWGEMQDPNETRFFPNSLQSQKQHEIVPRRGFASRFNFCFPRGSWLLPNQINQAQRPTQMSGRVFDSSACLAGTVGVAEGFDLLL